MSASDDSEEDLLKIPVHVLDAVQQALQQEQNDDQNGDK